MKTKTTTTNAAPFGPLIQVWDENVKEGDKPIISFGIKKAEAILASIEQIKQFVEDNKRK